MTRLMSIGRRPRLWFVLRPPSKVDADSVYWFFFSPVTMMPLVADILSGTRMLLSALMPSIRIGSSSPNATIRQVRIGVDRIWYRASRGRSVRLAPEVEVGARTMEEEEVGATAMRGDSDARRCWTWSGAAAAAGGAEGCPVRRTRCEDGYVDRKSSKPRASIPSATVRDARRTIDQRISFDEDAL